MCSQPEGGKAWGAYGHSHVRSKSTWSNLISSYDRVTGYVDKVEAIDVIDLRPRQAFASAPRDGLSDKPLAVVQARGHPSQRSYAGW